MKIITNYYKIAVCLFAFAGAGALFADVELVVKDHSFTITNKTSVNWTLGGVRFETEGGIAWPNDAIPSWDNAWELKSSGTYTEIVMKHGQTVNPPLVSPNGKKETGYDSEALRKFNQGCPWQNPNCNEGEINKRKILAGSETLLLKTGAPGVPDDPISAKPIDDLSEIDILMANSEFYDPNFRYRIPDDLGTNGGTYSGGFLDTWYDVETDKTYTQLQFAYPAGSKATFEPNAMTPAQIAPGKDYPEYWIGLAMIQEYFNVDAQWMWCVGAKETRVGTTAVVPSNNMGQAGVFGHWQVENTTGMDRALSYPQLFPKYTTQLSNARDVTTAGVAPNTFMGYYLRDPYPYSTPKDRALIFNEVLAGALVFYNNYDVIAYSKGACYKDGLAGCKDPYLGVLSAAIMYNMGVFGQYKSVLNIFSDPSIWNDPNARDRLPSGNSGYKEAMIKLIGVITDAAKDWHAKGSNSGVIDYAIDLDMLRKMYFGDGGTIDKQGNGGLLIHYYDANLANFNRAAREKIWNTLEAAFNKMKGKSPTTSGQNAISYRYDLLTIMRTVKAEISFKRNFQKKGDAETLLNGYDDKVQKPCPSTPVVHNEFPFAGFETTPDTNVFVVLDTVKDNYESSKVQWTIDYDWNNWQSAVCIDSSNIKKKVFRFSIPRSLAQQYYSDPNNAFVWVISENSMGNAVVNKLSVKFTRQPQPPKLEWAAVFDTTGNGLPDIIKVNVAGRDAKNMKCEWTWNSANGTVNGSSISSGGNILTIPISSLMTFGDGAGSGTFSIDYELLDENNSVTKGRVTADIKDSCGPAIKSAEYCAGENGKPDTLKVEFTEDVTNVDVYSNFIQLYFAIDNTGNGENRNLKVIEVDQYPAYIPNNREWMFLFDNKSIATDGNLNYFYVKMAYDATAITDEKGNLPLEINKWVPITDNFNYIELKIKKAAYFNTSNPADGYVDLIIAEFDFDKSYFDELSGYIAKVVVANFNENNAALLEYRKFGKITENDVKLSQNLLEIRVSQNKDSIIAMTGTNPAADVILFNGKTKLLDSIGIIASGRIAIDDNIAPVITKAYYSPMTLESDTADIVDTLYLYFSEMLSCDVSKEAMIPFSKSDNREYSFNFETVRAYRDSIVKVLVIWDSASIIPAEGDSIRIEGGRAIADIMGISQNINTVRVPLTVGKYHSNYSISIYPNPYTPTGGFETTSDDKLVRNPAIDKWGNPADAANMAIIVKPVGKRVVAQKLTANITVIDGLGNTIVEKSEFSQGRENEVIIWTWDGKNKRKRIVGAGTYQAIISVSNEIETNVYMRKIGIKK